MSTLYESYTGEDTQLDIRGTWWRAQTFTPATAHTISSVKLKLYRTGSPGNGTVSIKATDGSGHPTGADLCSASIAGNDLATSATVYEFSFSPGASLSASTKYAIVLRFPSGDSSNKVSIRIKATSPPYSGGNEEFSSDGGTSWAFHDYDCYFEDCGAPPYQEILPSSIASAEAFGTPTIEITLITIYPGSIESAESVGIPTVTKVRWHVILDGKYASLSAELNKAYVIGRDDSGINVYGSSTDSAELGLVGERLDFDLELEITTAALAADVAAAILAKRRLGVAKGYLVIPPNCGVELWDVVEVTDTPANQSTAKYRVAAIRFEYHPRQARFQHKLLLGAP